MIYFAEFQEDFEKEQEILKYTGLEPQRTWHQSLNNYGHDEEVTLRPHEQ